MVKYYFKFNARDIGTLLFINYSQVARINSYLITGCSKLSKLGFIPLICLRHNSGNAHKLPKPLTIIKSKELQNLINNLIFDISTCDWFIYDQPIKQIWNRESNLKVEKLIFDELTNHPLIGDNISNFFVNEVIALIKRLVSKDLEDLAINQKIDGKYIPFNNGLLNVQTSELLPIIKEHYITYKININYDPKKLLSTEMIDYLKRISADKFEALILLRSFIQLILLRDNKYQIAIYMYGPGGTGKSTLEKILTAIIGGNNIIVLSLDNINRTFGLEKIVDKTLILFSDIDRFKGETSKLKLLISGDPISIDRKYKPMINYQFKGLILLSGNQLWAPKDLSTGLQRRMIYFPIMNKPNNINPDFFNFDLISGLSKGILAQSLPGLVNWALSNPKENLIHLSKLGSIGINKITAPDTLIEFNPILAWIGESICYNNDSKVFIGNKASNPNSYLYSNYIKFCNLNGYKPLSINRFSGVVIDQLINTFQWKGIEKKKSNTGFYISNICLNSNNNKSISNLASFKNELPEFETNETQLDKIFDGHIVK